jgi:Helicase associated domain
MIPTGLAVHDNLRLDSERIEVLTHLGMVWEFPNEDYEEIWQGHFQDLSQFKTEHGHCNVPQKGYGKLSWWVKIQRELYVNTTTDTSHLPPRSRPRQTMPLHRIRQLESIGFEWRVRPHALKWDDRYQELLDYKKQYGDCNVPQVRDQ